MIERKIITIETGRQNKKHKLQKMHFIALLYNFRLGSTGRVGCIYFSIYLDTIYHFKMYLDKNTR